MSWDGLVVVIGASWWDGTPLAEHHMARELSAYAPVIYVDPPASVVTRFRNASARDAAAEPGLRVVSERLAVLSVRVPPLMERPLVKQVALARIRRAIRRSVRDLGATEVAALVVPTLEPLFGAADERTRVLYLKDDYVAGASLAGVSRRRLERMTERLPREADVVVAVSDVLAHRVAGPAVAPIVIPNGVDPNTFAATPLPARDGRGRAAFVGHLSERIDTGLLCAVVEAGVPLTMIGPRQETMAEGHLAVLAAHPDVRWTGAVPHSALAAALADVTTCLLPYTLTDFNRASSPLKLLEYLAAGRRVVSTDIPGVRALGTDLVTLADGPTAFTDAVLASLSTPLDVAEMERRRALAARHSWASRAATLAEAIGLHQAGPAASPTDPSQPPTVKDRP